MKNILYLMLFCLMANHLNAATVVKLKLPNNCNASPSNLESLKKDKDTQLTIFPNPSSGLFTVTVSFKSEIDKATINIYDLSGKSIFSETVFSNSNKLVKKFNMANLLSGSYILDIVNSTEASSTTLLIKK